MMENEAYDHDESDQEESAAFLPPSSSCALPVGTQVPDVRWVAVPSPTVIYPYYKHKQSLGIGVTLIFVGILGASLFVANIALGYATLYQPGVGLDIGIMSIIAGSFGIAAYKRRTKCLIVAFMVLCILNAPSCLPSVAVSIRVIYECRNTLKLIEAGQHSYGSPEIIDQSRFSGMLTIHACLLASALVAGIVSIRGATLGCQLFCCCSGSSLQETGPYEGGIQMVRYSISSARDGGANYHMLQQPTSPPSYDQLPPKKSII